MKSKERTVRPEKTDTMRGEQPGGPHHFKPGFYSRLFTRAERGDLEEQEEPGHTEGSGVSGEIELLRIAMRRAFERASQEADTLDAWNMVVATLSLAANRLGYLVRTQRILTHEKSDEANALSKALAEVIQEKGISE